MTSSELSAGRNIGVLVLIWLATTAFLAISGSVVNTFLWSGGSEPNWLGFPARDVVDTFLFAAWSYFLGRLTPSLFVGPRRFRLSWISFLVVPLYVFVMSGGWDAGNYTSLSWILFLFLLLAIPLATLT